MNIKPATFSRGLDGKGTPSVDTVIELGVDNRRVRISTYKTLNGALETTVRGEQVDGLFVTYKAGRNGDLYMKIGSPSTGRATEKALTLKHAADMSQLQLILAAAAGHYGLATNLADDGVTVIGMAAKAEAQPALLAA